MGTRMPSPEWPDNQAQFAKYYHYNFCMYGVCFSGGCFRPLEALRHVFPALPGVEDAKSRSSSELRCLKGSELSSPSFTEFSMFPKHASSRRTFPTLPRVRTVLNEWSHLEQPVSYGCQVENKRICANFSHRSLYPCTCNAQSLEPWHASPSIDTATSAEMVSLPKCRRSTAESLEQCVPS